MRILTFLLYQNMTPTWRVQNCKGYNTVQITLNLCRSCANKCDGKFMLLSFVTPNFIGHCVQYYLSLAKTKHPTQYYEIDLQLVYNQVDRRSQAKQQHSVHCLVNSLFNMKSAATIVFSALYLVLLFEGVVSFDDGGCVPPSSTKMVNSSFNYYLNN